MGFVVVGMSHHQTPEAMRQTYALSSECIQEFLKTLRVHNQGLIILSTCNRLELYSESLLVDRTHDLWRALLEFGHCAYREPSYRLNDRKCVEHTFKVALGLDSRILREHQVLGQMRKAFRYSEAQGLLSQGMRKLFERCFQMSKNIRTHWGKASLGLLAVKYLASIAHGRPIFILGAGDIVKDFLSHSEPLKDSPFILCNRTYENAVVAAKRAAFPVKILSFSQGLAQIADYPIIVLGLSTPRPLLQMSSFIANAQHYDIIDFGIPSALHPSLRDLPHITLKSLDSFHNEPLDSTEEIDVFVKIQQQIALFEQDMLLYKKRSLIVNYREKLKKECEYLTLQALMSYKRGGDPAIILQTLAYKMQQKLLHQPSIAFKKTMLESHHLDSFYHSADATSLSSIKSFESL